MTMPPDADAVIDALIPALRRARHVAVLTGAGISAESGLATFRDALTGLWATFDPEELATRQAFRRNPKLVWDWYAARREQLSSVQPNPGHLSLVALERHVPRVTVVTQNIDGLHQRAGSARVIELHGSLVRFKCFEEDVPIEQWDDTGGIPPRCPRCGGLVRPAVVWFGEQLPVQSFEDAVAAAEDCDVFLSIGTSGTVEPAASLPSYALDRGATVLVNNLEVSHRATPPLFHLNGRAGLVLPELIARAWPATGRDQT